MSHPDAIVVGSGPNGFSAAITLARAGLSVHVMEAESSLGGSLRSAELTLRGFVHDVCSALHPMAYASPFFASLPLTQHGVEWIHSTAALAHPLTGDHAVYLKQSVLETAAQFGEDKDRYRHLFMAAREAWKRWLRKYDFLSLVTHAPALMRMGLAGLRSASGFIEGNFRNQNTRALIAGMAAHAMLPLEKIGGTAVTLALATAGHIGGWPFPRGGAQKLSDALAGCLRNLGGTIETGVRVRSLQQLPPARAVLLDLTPRQLLEIAGDQLPASYSRRLQRYRYGMAAFKMDWALSAPVPWSCSGPRQAATIHLGGNFEEIAASERCSWMGRLPERPFIIAAQHSLFDLTRAPEGKHTLWAYCHVPNGCEVDMAERMEMQIERFAPGFRDTILARSVMPPRMLESHNRNLVGGDILGGTPDLRQCLIRPTFSYYATPLRHVYLCSASTPPGPGVHGLCGYLAARLALWRTFNRPLCTHEG